MILLAILLLILPFVLYWVYTILRFNRMLNLLPGPKPHFLAGNVLDLSNKPEVLFVQLRELAKTYPLGYRIWGAHVGTVNVILPEDVEIILSSMKHIEKGSIYNFLHPWLESGLLTSTGTKWQQRRKVLTPAFHFNILRRFVVVMNEHCQSLVQELQGECNKPKTNIIPIMSKHSLNILCETAMGISLDLKDGKQKKYKESIYGLAPLLIERSVKPWLYFDCIFNLSSMGRLQNYYLKHLHRFTREVIQKREENFNMNDINNLEEDDTLAVGQKKRLAMLDLLIYAKNTGEFIDNQGIREETDTFMFEGHDTVSMALTFALMLIAKHKEVQDNIYAELKDIFGNDKRSPTLDDLQNMKYLEMCLKESMRIYPSVPFISRTINEDLQLHNFMVPAGTMAQIHIFDLHHNPEIYKDPYKYDPDRFLPENCQGRHPYAYIPFSAGPRNCIGQKFAFLEMKCVMSSILRNFELEPVSTPDDVQLKVDMVLRSNCDVNVKFRPRVS